MENQENGISNKILEFQKRLDVLHKQVETTKLTQIDMDWLQVNYNSILKELGIDVPMLYSKDHKQIKHHNT